MKDETLSTLRAKAKLVLRITTNAFDAEIDDIILAGWADLKTRGIIFGEDEIDPLILRALMTYVRLHFGEPEHPERLAASYWEQKAMLMSTSGYTDWGD